MQFQQHVDVSAATFYQNLLHSIQLEYAYHHGQMADAPEELSLEAGMSYQVESEAGSYRVELHELLPNERYETVIYSNRGRTHIIYEIEPTPDDNGALITYRETTESANIFQRWNELLIGTLFKKKIKQGVQRKIEQIAHLNLGNNIKKQKINKGDEQNV
ncbi:DUF3284 domain-containing protein [Allofustis seminis]|uniref:DUF3284 domain-containing protein n=1 Tax=Allofustis seminis TaxID=166939 RepID=UPI00036DF37B|nr:DUF3284 domain-containing protein [Allofustis seminis]